MALSIHNPIVANEIDSVHSLRRLKIFKLVGFQNERLVVKLEQMLHGLDKTQPDQKLGRKEALSVNVNLMRSVDPDAEVVVLTGDELQAIREYIDYQLKIARELRNPLSVPVQELSQALEFGGKWVKMEFKDLMNLDDVGNDRLGGNKTGVRQFAAALKAPGGLEKLGEIIAVDLFNHNRDRFALRTTTEFNNIRLKFLVNIGNVFLSSRQVSGLDSWDPFSTLKVTRKHLNEQLGHNEWGGYLLQEHGTVTINGRVITRGVFAEGAIDDLETVLGPRDRNFFLLRNKRLPMDAKRRLKQGMMSGATKIRDHLRELRRREQFQGKRLPVLLQDKITALGWDPL
jgi:hypothetical protein